MTMNVLLMVNLKKSQSRNTLQNYSYFIQVILTLADFRLNKTSHGSLSSGHQDLLGLIPRLPGVQEFKRLLFCEGK